MKPRVFPETPPPGIYPDDMNKHLQPVWCNVRNSIVDDQRGIESALLQIKNCKNTIRWLKERVLVSKTALDELGKIKETSK